MSYKSIRTITSIVVEVLLIIAYTIYIMNINPPDPNNLKSWAATMLVFIGIGIVSLIITLILFNIVYSIGIAVKKRECEDKEIERLLSSSAIEDEMDKLISLKSSHVAYICVGIGFVVGLIALAFGLSVVVTLHILVGSMAIGTITEGGVSIYLYERGV